MYRKLWRVCWLWLTVLVAVGLTAQAGLAAALHTITVDGDVSDWAADEALEVDAGRQVYATWDDTNLYIGLLLGTGEYLGDTAGDKSFFVAIDTDLAANSGAGSDGYGRVNFPGAHRPEVFYAFAGAAGNYEWASWNGASWDYQGGSDAGTYYDWSGNTASAPGNELTIPLANLGDPDGIAVYLWTTTEGASDVESAWPTPNATGASPDFLFAYHFPLLDGVTPGASVLADHVVINEFVATPTSAEIIELYNPTASDVDLSSWSVDWGSGSATVNAGQVITAGHYLVLDNDNTSGISISNGGTVLSLQDGSAILVDAVGYGDDGGAPKPIYNFSAARVPNGTDTDDDALDFNMDTSPTVGAPNDGPPSLLGSSSVHLNEVAPNGVSGEEGVAFIELYNDGSAAVDLAGYMLQASDEYTMPAGSTVAAGGFFTVSGAAINGSASFFNLDDVKDNLYLYDAAGARIDQLGWDGRSDAVANGESFQRIPDGAGPLDGYNWSNSGGEVTLFQLAPTEAETNVPAADFIVSKSGPSYVFAGETVVYTIDLDNQSPLTVTNVVMTETLEGLTYVGDDSGVTPGNPATGVYVWMLGDVPTDTTTVHVTATVASGLTPGDSVTNTVDVTLDLLGDDPANNSAQVVGTVPEIVAIATARAGSEGDIFAVEGSVIVPPGTYNATEWALQDATGGIAVYDFPPPAVALGDQVRLVGRRGAYAEQEQFTDIYKFTNLGSGSPPAPAVTTTGDVDAGLTEGWLVQVEGVVAGMSDCSDGNFTVDDGSGAVTIYIDGDTGIDLCARGVANGDTLTVIGFSTQHYSTYEIKPRFESDIIVRSSRPLIEKEAPAAVELGEVYTYTLTVRNFTGLDLTGVVITDAVPANTAFAFSVDGGVAQDGIVTWMPTAPLTDQTTMSVSFAVTTTGDLGEDIWNHDYVVRAANWVTPGMGAPVFTYIGGMLPIPAIQGDGDTSAYVGQQVTTVGVVIGIFEDDYDGFFIQDPTGDADDTTSDGIMVIVDGGANVSPGDWVTVTGTVEEESEWSGPCTVACQTQIASAANLVEVGGTVALPAAVEPDPPGDPDLGMAYWEAHEGMLLSMPYTATVVGPTSYGMIYVVPGDLGLERVMRTDMAHAGMPVGAIAFNGWGTDLIVGSIVSNVDGPLAQTYDSYAIVTQPGDDLVVETAATPPATLPSWPDAAMDEFSAGTYNTYNFHATSGYKMTKVVSTVVAMGCPTFLSVQEIAVETVMSTLLTHLGDAGCAYDYAYSHPDVGGHGVAVLWRTEVVADVTWSTDYQACSPYGSPTATAYDPITATCGTDEYPLFSRRPVVITGTVSYGGVDREVVVIGNHFKSKSGGDAGALRRLEQAQFVAGLVDDLVDAGSDNVLVLGDLNDFADSDALASLYASGNLTNTWYTLPEDARYSYIYQGRSQILDHVLASPALWSRLETAGPLHYNADFPHNTYAYDETNLWRSSDHDPLASTFSLQAVPDLALYKTVVPQSDVMPGATVTYTLELSNTGETTATGVMLYDELPIEITAFGGWVSQPAGAVAAGRVVTWTGAVGPEMSVTLSFTALLRDEATIQLGTTVTNTATFTSTNAGEGQDEAVFVVGERETMLFLPLLMRES